MLISCLQNYKYKLNRKTETQSNLLENMHLEAIRIIIGAVKGTNHQKLYEESGFCSLKERRRRQTNTIS